MSRLDLLWTMKFQNEKHEVETVSTISRLLLENILPKHVAEIIIKENMSQVGDCNYEHDCSMLSYATRKPKTIDVY
jgi:hypothetical protein